MKEIIKIERFLENLKDIFTNPFLMAEKYSRLFEITVYVNSDFGDYPDLIDFEAEILAADRNLIERKAKDINSICDKLINDFDFYHSTHKTKPFKTDGIPDSFKKSIANTLHSYNTYHLTTWDNINKKELHFNESDLMNTVYNIKSILKEIIQGNQRESSDIKTLTIPDNILTALQENKFIEDKNARPLTWLKNKQLARELLTHPKIKGTLSVAEIERLTPETFFYLKEDNQLQLAKNKSYKNPDTFPPDKRILDKILATL